MAEVRGRPPGGRRLETLEVIVVEITMVNDFGAGGVGRANLMSTHKVDQFEGTMNILKSNYGTDIPITYYFYAPKDPSGDARAYILSILKTHQFTNAQVIWRRVA